MFFLDVGVGKDAQPVAAILGNHHFAAYLDAADFLRTEIGGDVEPCDAKSGGSRACHGLLQVVFLFLGCHGQRTESEAECEQSGLREMLNVSQERS